MFNVTRDNIPETMWYLSAMALVVAFVPPLFLWILPTKDDIEQAQNAIQI